MLAICNTDWSQIPRECDAVLYMGFRIQWRRKRGTTKSYVYTFIADQLSGWAAYFRHAVAKQHHELARKLRVAQGDSLVEETVPLELA